LKGDNMKTEQKPLHINRLEIESFMRVKALRVQANGKPVILNGPNASGKTSAVQAISWAIQGPDARKIPEPIHQGEDRARVMLDLGAYTVTREKRADGKYSLTLKAADGSKITRPQELLNSFLSDYSIDPVATWEEYARCRARGGRSGAGTRSAWPG